MNNKFPMMLYRQPGTEPIHGGYFATITVESDEALEAALSVGWRLTTPEAIEAAKPPPAPPTRAEMEIKAAELGIKFSDKTADAALLKAINDKLAAG